MAWKINNFFWLKSKENQMIWFPHFCILKSMSSLSHILHIIFSVNWEQLESSSEEWNCWSSSSSVLPVKMHVETHPLGLTTTWTHKTNSLTSLPGDRPLTSVKPLLFFPDGAKGLILWEFWSFLQLELSPTSAPFCTYLCTPRTISWTSVIPRLLLNYIWNMK